MGLTQHLLSVVGQHMVSDYVILALLIFTFALQKKDVIKRLKDSFYV